jgi:serine protease DegQ
MRGGPADNAGIRPRDVVLEVDGKPTPATPTLLARIAAIPPGHSVRVKLWRDRAVLDLDVVVGKRPRTAQP